MINKVGFGSTSLFAQKNSLSFGISKERLETIINKKDLFIYSTVHKTDQGKHFHEGYLATNDYIESTQEQGSAPYTIVPTGVCFLDTDKNINFITATGNSPDEMFNNMAESIPKGVKLICQTYEQGSNRVTNKFIATA